MSGVRSKRCAPVSVVDGLATHRARFILDFAQQPLHLSNFQSSGVSLFSCVPINDNKCIGYFHFRK